MKVNSALTAANIAGTVIAAKLMNRAAQYEKRTGRRPETLNLSRSEYQLLVSTSSIFDTYGASAWASKKPAKPTWRGFKLRVRNYRKERDAKERRVAGGVRTLRRVRPRTLNIAGLYGLTVAKSPTAFFDTSV